MIITLCQQHERDRERKGERQRETDRDRERQRKTETEIQRGGGLTAYRKLDTLKISYFISAVKNEDICV